MKMPDLAGLNENDLKLIEALADVADDRFAETMKVMLKEIRRLVILSEHLKIELHTALNPSKFKRTR